MATYMGLRKTCSRSLPVDLEAMRTTLVPGVTRSSQFPRESRLGASIPPQMVRTWPGTRAGSFMRRTPENWEAGLDEGVVIANPDFLRVWLYLARQQLVGCAQQKLTIDLESLDLPRFATCRIGFATHGSALSPVLLHTLTSPTLREDDSICTS